MAARPLQVDPLANAGSAEQMVASPRGSTNPIETSRAPQFVEPDVRVRPAAEHVRPKPVAARHRGLSRHTALQASDVGDAVLSQDRRHVRLGDVVDEP